MAYSLVWKLATSTQLDLIKEVKTARARLLRLPNHYLKMRLNRKRKQQLREILRRQREEEDLWDEYEDISTDTSSDESSLIEYSSDEEESGVEVVGDNKQEGLGDSSDGGVQRGQPSKLISSRGLGCGLSTTDKSEKTMRTRIRKMLLIYDQ